MIRRAAADRKPLSIERDPAPPAKYSTEIHSFVRQVQAPLRYLLNLPILVAAFGAGLFLYLAVLSDKPSGGDAQMGAALAIVFAAFLYTVALAVALIGCVAVGGFDWIPAEGRGLRFVIVIAGFIAIGLLCFAAISITMETTGSDQRWDHGMVVASRWVAIGMPAILILYAAWVVDAPAELRAVAASRYALFAGIAIFGALAGFVTIKEMARWNQQAAADAAAEQEREDEDIQQTRRNFAALTDADPLFTWDGYVGYYKIPDDIRETALKRIAARPMLEADLTEALASGNSLWVQEALSLVVRLPFQPSSGLSEPVTRAIDRLTSELAEEAKAKSYDGDQYIDHYRGSLLSTVRDVAVKMASGAGLDLSDRLDRLQAVVIEGYPKSGAASTFPGEVKATKKQIAAALAARTP
ncbi:hypothetical protein [Hypericibacter sp.]|uniref:hypothetical protein n=1 Tax=Hypericibacter sp. TaxID=2705401 RepID=UPI003D6D54E8